ncbi:MAG TPA: hypothetical protein VIO36_05580 [Anaerolineaceae bacterium]
MSIIPLSNVAAYLDLKRTPAGLEINASRGQSGCLEAALTVARFFLGELQVSPSLARIVTGQEGAMVFTLAEPGASQEQAVVLALEDYLIYPVSQILRGWSLVHPTWVEVPVDVRSQNPAQNDALEWRVMAEYNIDLYRQEKDLCYPLYETILMGIQACLFDRLQLEMHSLYSLYLEIEGKSNEIDDGRLVELEFLARPAMYLLNRVIPALSPKGTDIITETYLNGHLVTGENVQFEFNYMSANWAVYYRNGKKWETIPHGPEASMPPLPLIARREFLSVFYDAAAFILARKLHEIQKRIYRYKLKAV